MKTNSLSLSVLVLVSNLLVFGNCDHSKKQGLKAKGDFEEENYGVKYADKCEVCKVVTGEVEFQLNSKFRSPEVIETGYNYMMRDANKAKKKTKYETSMIRLQEALESTCGAILEYNIHKERKDWTRFARGQSQTFKTLHGLKNKGVKVDLGIPHEMWDKPSAEITQLKIQCETFLENNEEDIEEWFQKGSQIPLEDHICKKKLKKKERDCLAIKALPEPTPVKKSKEEKKPKKKEKSATELKEEKKVKSEEDPIIAETVTPTTPIATPAVETKVTEPTLSTQETKSESSASSATESIIPTPVEDVQQTATESSDDLVIATDKPKKEAESQSTTEKTQEKIEL